MYTHAGKYTLSVPRDVWKNDKRCVNTQERILSCMYPAWSRTLDLHYYLQILSPTRDAKREGTIDARALARSGERTRGWKTSVGTLKLPVRELFSNVFFFFVFRAKYTPRQCFVVYRAAAKGSSLQRVRYILSASEMREQQLRQGYKMKQGPSKKPPRSFHPKEIPLSRFLSLDTFRGAYAYQAFCTSHKLTRSYVFTFNDLPFSEKLESTFAIFQDYLRRGESSTLKRTLKLISTAATIKIERFNSISVFHRLVYMPFKAVQSDQRLHLVYESRLYANMSELRDYDEVSYAFVYRLEEQHEIAMIGSRLWLCLLNGVWYSAR